jgi:molybdopterin converting factor small subunit
VGHNTTVRQLVVNLGLEEWIAFGLSVAVNGERCSMDKELLQGQEVALLPPVSGG